MTHRTVIVGAGVAGVSAAGAMRSAGYQGVIDLLGDELELPYRRPTVSKELLRGEKTSDEVRIRKAMWFEEQSIGLRSGVAVTSIDTEARAVRLDDDEAILYDQLLVATGGRARSPWPAHGVRTLRGLNDVPRLREEIGPDRRIVVVGGGLVGSEIAASARELGCEVVLLEAASLPLPRLLPPALGQMYVDLHTAAGTELHTDVLVASITDEGEDTVVRAVDGRTWRAHTVVVAIGMDPNVELAESAGILTAPWEDGAGIVVDEFGSTSTPGVFAAGDVANQPNRVLGGRHRVEHWQGAQNHGAAVGRIMSGGDQAFAEVPWCWSDQYGLTLQVTGWPQAHHELVVNGSIDDRDFIAYLLDDGVVRGAVGIGRARDIRIARSWIADRERLSEVRPEAGG